MNKNYDIDTIISVEQFKENRKRHLERDVQKKQEHKKEMIRNAFGVVLFYVVLIIGVFLIDARMNQIDNQKSAIEPLTQIAQKQNR